MSHSLIPHRRLARGHAFSLSWAAAAAQAALALAAPALHAQEAVPPTAAASAPVDAGTLRRVVVTATRVETSEDDVTTTVTVIDDKDIERKQPTDIKDLLRDEVGVAVRAQPNRSSAAFYGTGRGGNEGVNIRGLEGNHVLMQTDGMRLPMAYAYGPTVAGRGDYIDVEAYKRVELLRGPSSTAYGSDGLAGAISFVTKDPADLLAPGRNSQAHLKLGYSSADDSWVAVPAFALRDGSVEAMLLASVRRGHETDNMGDNDAQNNTRTTPNPQNYASNYLLGKWLWRASPEHQLKLSAEHLRRTVDTDVYTLFGDMFYPTTTNVDASERISRSALKADYSYTPQGNPFIRRAWASLWWQGSKNRQLGWEERISTSWDNRVRDNRYGERQFGASAQAETYAGEGQEHRLVWGGEVSSSWVHSLRDGASYLGSTPVPSPGTPFPSKVFPDTRYTQAGLFAQDEISFETVTITPGLRVDKFRLTPKDDPLYALNNAVAPVALSGHAVSPKLGAVWRVAPMLAVFGQYAHGFRAPTPWQVNGGMSNPFATPPYLTIGNADLKPETSRTLELGLRGNDGTLRYSVAAFKARYRDFIAENVQVSGAGTPTDPIVFQSRNLSSVDIHGFEASAAWTINRNWTLAASYAHAHGSSGDGNGARVPLESINPDKGVLRLRYQEPQQWGSELIVTGMRSQHRPPPTIIIMPSLPPASPLVPKGFIVADVEAWWQATPSLMVNLALTNLTNRKYTLWSDVRAVGADTPIADAFTQPGRAVSVSARMSF